ncbi:hypothetical protein D9M68_989930 [compost metagenome]
MQRHRMARTDRFEPSDARPARHHVVLGVHLEPQALDTRAERGLVVLRLEAEAGREDVGHGGVRSAAIRT